MAEPGSEPTVEVFLGTAAEALETAERCLERASGLAINGQHEQANAELTAAVAVLYHQVHKLAAPTKAERAGMC